MTIKECIDTVYAVKPHEYTEVDQVRWLSFVEKIIIDEVLKTHEGYDGRYDEFTEYSPDNTSVELIVPSPHDRLYVAFLTMKIDELNNEIERFNNSRLLYNTYMLEYRKHYNKTHMPLSVTGYNKPHHPVRPQIGLSEAEFENLQRSLYYQLSEDFAKMTSQDRLNEIISSYLMNNVAVFKGKDGRDGKDGKNGVDGTVEFANLTPSQKLSLKGEKGDKGDKGEDGKDGDVTSEYVNNNFSNNLKETVSGINLVRLDAVSPVEHKINVSLEPSNLINQEEFFASNNNYEIHGEIGKTYVFKCSKLSGENSGYIVDYDENQVPIMTGDVHFDEYTLTIQEGHTYYWRIDGLPFSDVYESVSMVLADVSNVNLKSYGKNISRFEGNWATEGTRYIFSLQLPCSTMTASVISKATGTVKLQVSIDGSDFKDVANGALVQNGNIRKVTFLKKPNEEYRVWASLDGKNGITDIQVELGNIATEIEPYKESDGVVLRHPTTTLISDTIGVNIKATYNKDINDALMELKQAILNLGGIM